MKFSAAAVVLPAFLIVSASASATLPQQNLVHSFSFWSVDNPTPLFVGRDGHLYVSTRDYSSSTDDGTLFRILADDSFSMLGICPWTPYATLMQSNDGSFYGTTYRGGANGYGTVFKCTPGVSAIALHSFDGGLGGGIPYAGLVQGTGGDFYGTTTYFGASVHTTDNTGLGYGTVFKITSAGHLTTLHNFNLSDGAYPHFATLLQGRDGNFYGTTVEGGATGHGTVFKVTAGGTLTTLHSFSDGDGYEPFAGLTQASDGHFYGTALAGGTGREGTVYRITSGGSLTTLYNFSGDDGATPFGGVVEGTDGNFYGTSNNGGPDSFGTIFRITPEGSLTTLHHFNRTDGAYPMAGLVQRSDGTFYGTTTHGGAGLNGTVFRITVALTPTKEQQCKNGKWATFNSPRTFKNQGDCIQFVNTGR